MEHFYNKKVSFNNGLKNCPVLQFCITSNIIFILLLHNLNNFFLLNTNYKIINPRANNYFKSTGFLQGFTIIK